MSPPTATLRLRGILGPVEALIHVPPRIRCQRLVVAFLEPGSGADLSSSLGAIVVAIPPTADANVQPVLDWIAAHATELGASTDDIAVLDIGDGATRPGQLVTSAAQRRAPRCDHYKKGTSMPIDSLASADEAIPQGDARLLTTTTARALLCSSIPARLAFLATDGSPRIVPTWFHWTGDELVMGTFVSAPHVTEPAARVHALRANPRVAVTIDTNQFPPQALTLRGDAVVTEHDGVVAEYAEAARRYLGAEASAEYLAMLDDPSTVMVRIAVKPTWIGLIDFQARMPRPLGGIRPAPDHATPASPQANTNT